MISPHTAGEVDQAVLARRRSFSVCSENSIDVGQVSFLSVGQCMLTLNRTQAVKEEETALRSKMQHDKKLTESASTERKSLRELLTRTAGEASDPVYDGISQAPVRAVLAFVRWLRRLRRAVPLLT